MLYERESELARIDAAVRQAREGRSSVLLLTGPLGIGRSTLLQEAGAAPPGDLRVLRANAAPMEQDFAYGIVHQLLGPLLSDGLPALGDHEAPDSEAVLHGLRSLLADASATVPVLLLVDDLQWVDLPSLRWLAYLVRRAHGMRVALVCTLRDGDPRAEHPLVGDLADAADLLHLAPLSLDGTRALIHHHLGEVAAACYAQACHDTCGGNPLFLQSVLRDQAVEGHRPTPSRSTGSAPCAPPSSAIGWPGACTPNPVRCAIWPRPSRRSAITASPTSSSTTRGWTPSATSGPCAPCAASACSHARTRRASSTASCATPSNPVSPSPRARRPGSPRPRSSIAPAVRPRT
ncbi:AAA family ATPase [Streptomyces albulus]|nr:AAA family ATPase [Streptomyces noursei]